MEDLLCLKASVSFSPCIETSFYRLRVAFKGGFAPAEVAVFVGNLDEEPTWWYSKIFDLCYLAHSVLYAINLDTGSCAVNQPVKGGVGVSLFI